MASNRNRARARSNRLGGHRPGRAGMVGLDSNLIPRVVVGAVNGVEAVAVGALRIARDVLLRAVAGAADIGAGALTATTAGVRGVVSAASRMVGDIAGAAQGTLRETVNGIRHSRRRLTSLAFGQPPSETDGREATTSRSAVTRRPRRRARRLRAVPRPARTSAAA